MEQPPPTAKADPGKIVPLVIIGVGLVIIGVVLALFLIKPNPPNNSSVVPAQVNFPAPELILNDLSGAKIKISDYRDQIVMINNWATWCPPCKAEMPTLSKYYKNHKEQGFTLFGIEAGDPKEAVASFVKDYKISFPVLLDPNNKSLTLFRNDSLPSSYVIDHDGNVVLAWTGPISMDMLEKYVTPLLEQ
jgi:cytochrome c biogenesis protein CcmG, thiol:disulfide interchange protein DsbE